MVTQSWRWTIGHWATPQDSNPKIIEMDFMSNWGPILSII